MRFCFDSWTVRPAHRRRLERLSRSLATAARVRVVGHADAIGKRPYNSELSRKRAVTVARALGIDASDGGLDWYGENRPKAANTHADGRDNPSGRALNRRVKVIIIG